MKQLFGLDTSSFKTLREENLIYIDKTRWILNLVTTGRAFFLSRPRRFGKSLAVSTLKELFKGNSNLFKGLYIEDKWTFKPYPVLIFDFNKIQNTDLNVFEDNLRFILFKFYKENSINIPDTNDLLLLFAELVTGLYKKYNQRVVILIDEYDKPIIDHLGYGQNGIDTAKNNRKLLKNFFGTLKASDVVDALKFVFVTGVSRFSKISIFSEWNNLTDITMHSDYADFLGYTDDEIKTYCEDYLYDFCREKKMGIEECLGKLKYHYNGYRFSEERDIKVFNPISIMNCLNDKTFKNYWFSTATPSFLVNLIKEKNYFIPGLEHAEIDDSMLESFDIENIDIVPMLFQTGYLTLKNFDGTLFSLSYPNEEVKKSFNKILLKTISEKSSTTAFAQKLGNAFKNENHEDIKFFINAIFNEIPYPHFKNADENYFHTIIYMALSLMGFNTKSELLNSRGRLDLALIFPDKVFVIEFKCDVSAVSAVDQIKEKNYALKWKNNGLRTIICGISFDTKKREVKEILFEE
ncbi:MAG: AAA family ATPase [Desulfobacteraceae bacterium]|nr:AAA family ATPase [Desulfobacteraceae bacterium]MCB9495250.1 AAA family ATPase [Desulfobacteraceae bacterium]